MGAGSFPPASTLSPPGSFPSVWCRLRHSAAVAVPSTTAGVAWGVTHPWDTEDGDSASMHSLVTNTSRVILPVAGLYVATFFGAMATPAGGYEGFRIVANGAGGLAWSPSFPVVAASIWGNSNVADQTVPVIGTFVCTNPGVDYLEFQAMQSGGTSKNINAGTGYPSTFTVYLAGT